MCVLHFATYYTVVHKLYTSSLKAAAAAPSFGTNLFSVAFLLYITSSRNSVITCMLYTCDCSWIEIPLCFFLLPKLNEVVGLGLFTPGLVTAILKGSLMPTFTLAESTSLSSSFFPTLSGDGWTFSLASFFFSVATLENIILYSIILVHYISSRRKKAKYLL